MDEMEVFFEIHQGLPRESAGSDASTSRALRVITDLPVEPGILDVGCGPGAQTVLLAKLTGGRVVGLDNHQPFLDELARKAEVAGVSDRIETVNGSMLEMDFAEESFDLIWSEGAIFIMGFDKGLTEWRKFLKPGGWIAVSECCWLREDASDELRKFWDEVYPAIRTIQGNVDALAACGYDNIGHFVQPESDWWGSYYKPMIKRMETLRPKYEAIPEARKVLDAHDAEIELYRKYSDYYGYVFFIARRPEAE